jgi:alpha-galactosidase/6-phospho-beta-glucosidase family protein
VQAVVDRYGVSPVVAGDIHPGLALHLGHHWAAQQATVRAALSGDRRDALEAFRLDPLLDAVLEPDGAARLLDEMLDANSAHLPRFR